VAITNSGAALKGLILMLGPNRLATEKQFTMNFWSNVPVAGLMKLKKVLQQISKSCNHAVLDGKSF